MRHGMEWACFVKVQTNVAIISKPFCIGKPVIKSMDISFPRGVLFWAEETWSRLDNGRGF